MIIDVGKLRESFERGDSPSEQYQEFTDFFDFIDSENLAIPYDKAREFCRLNKSHPIYGTFLALMEEMLAPFNCRLLMREPQEGEFGDFLEFDE